MEPPKDGANTYEGDGHAEVGTAADVSVLIYLIAITPQKTAKGVWTSAICHFVKISTGEKNMRCGRIAS